MCCVDKNAAYEAVICTKEDEAICAVGFTSVSMLCRFLDMFNFDHGKISVIRKKDHTLLDIDILLSIWRNE